MLLIQACGVGLVAAYYAVPSVRESLAVVAAVKAQNALTFALIGSVIAGGLFPELAKMALGERRWTSLRWRDLAHTSLMFGLNGIVLDLFYGLQARLVGSGHDWTIVARKIAVDALIFTPLVSLPIFLLLVMLREQRWSVPALVRRLDRSVLSDRVIPILVPCWIYWVPLQACIYSLPLDLQYAFALVCIAAWSLVLIFITKRMDRPGLDQGHEAL